MVRRFAIALHKRGLGKNDTTTNLAGVLAEQRPAMDTVYAIAKSPAET